MRQSRATVFLEGCLSQSSFSRVCVCPRQGLSSRPSRSKRKAKKHAHEKKETRIRGQRTCYMGGGGGPDRKLKKMLGRGRIWPGKPRSYIQETVCGRGRGPCLVGSTGVRPGPMHSAGVGHGDLGKGGWSRGRESRTGSPGTSRASWATRALTWFEWRYIGLCD